MRAVRCGLTLALIAACSSPAPPSAKRSVLSEDATSRASWFAKPEVFEPQLSPGGRWLLYQVRGDTFAERVRIVPSDAPTTQPQRLPNRFAEGLGWLSDDALVAWGSCMVWLAQPPFQAFPARPWQPPNCQAIEDVFVGRDLRAVVAWDDGSRRRYATVQFAHDARPEATPLAIEPGWKPHFLHGVLVAESRRREGITRVRGDSFSFELDRHETFLGVVDAPYAIRFGDSNFAGLERFEEGAWQEVHRYPETDVVGGAIWDESWVAVSGDLASGADYHGLLATRLARYREDDGRPVIASMDDARRALVVRVLYPHRPTEFWLDVDGGPPARLREYPEGAEGIVPRVVRIPARDGLTLSSVLHDRGGATPRPLLVYVHGGPESQLRAHYVSTLQFLADRGYAVLAVNFRGSTGFGRRFCEAGFGRWHDKVQDDLDDAVAWAIREGIADPDRVGILGESFGGYSTMLALTRPSPFRCGVSINGPTDLELTLAHRARPWMGYPDEAARRAASPVARIAELDRPLLVLHGTDDPNVTLEHAAMLLREAPSEAPMDVVGVPFEGHNVSSFSRPVVAGLAELYFAGCLGGSREPFGPDLEESVADLIPLRLRSRKLEALWEPDARWELLPLPSQVSARYVSFTPLGEDRFALITLRSAEVLEVDSAAAWRSLPLPRSPRSHHAAVRLPTGELMITGGLDPEGTALRSTEILGLDGVWRDGPELTEARLRHSAVVTTGGTVLVFGGEREGRALVTTERLRGDAWRRYDDGERATTRGNLWPGDGFAVLTASDYFVWADHGRVWRLAEGALQMRTDETATLLDAEGEPSRDIAVPGMFRSAIQLRDGSIAAVVERTLYRGREPFDAWEQLAELPPRLRGNLSLTELQDGSLLVFATEPFLQAARLRLSE